MMMNQPLENATQAYSDEYYEELASYEQKYLDEIGQRLRESLDSLDVLPSR